MLDISKTNENRLFKFVLDKQLATPLKVNATEDTYVMRAHGLILLVICGLIFSNIFENMIKRQYLLH